MSRQETSEHPSAEGRQEESGIAALGGLFESLDTWAEAKLVERFFAAGLRAMERHSVNQPADVPEQAQHALLEHWYGLPDGARNRVAVHLGLPDEEQQ